MMKKLTAVALVLALQVGVCSSPLFAAPKSNCCCKPGDCNSSKLSCCEPTGPSGRSATSSAPLSEILKVSVVAGYFTILAPHHPSLCFVSPLVFSTGSDPPQLFVLKSSFLI